MWSRSLSTNGEPIHSQGTVALTSKNAFTSMLLTLIWVGFLGVRFEVGRGSGKINPLSKTH